MSAAPTAAQVQRALAWLAAIEGDDATRAEAAGRAARAWRAASPRHDAAWAEAERRWRGVAGWIGEAGPGLREALQARDGVGAGRRRGLLRAAGGGLGALLLGVLGWQALPRLDGRWLEQTVATGRARHLNDRPLPDGSRLDLAAETRLAIRFGRRERRIELLQGLARFTVATDLRHGRPFIVATRLGEVRVTGTTFTVSDRGGGVRVTVQHGEVQVRVANETHRLGPGEGLLLHAGAPAQRLADGPLRTGAAAAGADWREGWWRFVDTTLAEAVAEVNAYLPEPIVLAPAVRTLRLTGSFPIRQPTALLEALPRVLPVQVRHEAAGWTVLPAVR